MMNVAGVQTFRLRRQAKAAELQSTDGQTRMSALRGARKKAPGKVGSQGGKGHHPFPGAIGRSRVIDRQGRNAGPSFVSRFSSLSAAPHLSTEIHSAGRRAIAGISLEKLPHS